MNTILITGLDGSGKSTILKELSKVKNKNDFEIINLPIIDIQSIGDDNALIKAAKFVNQLNKMADVQKLPSLKAIAIFSAMLLFKKIFEFKSRTLTKTVFCERHPLIDTIVYAQFYAERSSSLAVNEASIAEMEEKYHEELQYLLQLLPSSIAIDKKPFISWFAAFIFKRFFIDKKLSVADLKELFGIILPDKIYYLKADAETLYQRIAKRDVREAHESVEILQNLGLAYDKLFKEISSDNSNLIEIIDAEQLSNLDEFRDRIFQKYCSTAK